MEKTVDFARRDKQKKGIARLGPLAINVAARFENVSEIYINALYLLLIVIDH